MAARTTRVAARQRVIQAFMASLERIIPEDESKPLKGCKFPDWQLQAQTLKQDWNLESLDGKQVQRWSEALGQTLVARRDAEVRAYREGRRPEAPAHPPQLLVLGVDGGRRQGREKDEATQSRWREEKVLTATTFLPGNGKEGQEEVKPKPLVTTVLAQNVGYFTKHKEHMRYPEYRAKGWPIGSGITEAGVRQFNKRIKGTEQFWSEQGIEAILALRGQWVSQDQRWERYWSNRPAYVN